MLARKSYSFKCQIDSARTNALTCNSLFVSTFVWSCRWDNQINVVETLTVNKTDAVTYIDDDGSKPERWARVSIMFGVSYSLARRSQRANAVQFRPPKNRIFKISRSALCLSQRLTCP